MYKDEDYKKIFYLVINNQLVGYPKYQRLAPYNDILKLMLEPCNGLIYVEEHTKDCLRLLRKIPAPKHNIDENMIKLCKYNDSFNIIPHLECIFAPKDVIEDGTYIRYFMNIFMHLIHNFVVDNNDINFSYSKLKNYCLYYENLTYNNTFWRYRDICITLLSYIYANDADYQILNQFLSDPEYFTEVLKMNDIDFNKTGGESNLDREYIKLYKKGNFLFSKNLKIIK